MSWKKLSVLATALALTGAFAAQALAQRDDDDDRRRWIELGERRVNMSAEKDVIRIGRGDEWWKDRGFRRLYLKAERGEIRVFAVRLVYKHPLQQDPHEDFQIGQTLQEGQDLMIKLSGEKKYLEEVQFLYRAKASFDGAVVKLYGVPSRRTGGDASVVPPGTGSWVDLGCRQVAMQREDRDAIRVGARDGRFKAIRLLARGADVELREVAVVYGNDSRERLSDDRLWLRQGQHTRPFDLRGWERSINRIDVTYVRIPNFKGQATVCAEGLQ